MKDEQVEHILMSPAVCGAVDMLLVAQRHDVPDAARQLVREILKVAEDRHASWSSVHRMENQ